MFVLDASVVASRGPRASSPRLLLRHHGRVSRVVGQGTRRSSAPALPRRPRDVLARRRLAGYRAPPGPRRRLNPRSAARRRRVHAPTADGGRGRARTARDALAAHGRSHRGSPRMDPRGAHVAAHGRDRRTGVRALRADGTGIGDDGQSHGELLGAASDVQRPLSRRGGGEGGRAEGDDPRGGTGRPAERVRLGRREG